MMPLNLLYIQISISLSSNKLWDQVGQRGNGRKPLFNKRNEVPITNIGRIIGG
jgi:hypothetical protein